MGGRLSVNRHGNLVIRLYWKGRESKESTGRKATAENRRIAQRKFCDPITAEIKAGTFDARRYLYYFPRGSRADEMRGELGLSVAETSSEIPTVEEYAKLWQGRNKPPVIRVGQERDRKQHLDRYIVPSLGEAKLNEVTPARIVGVREVMLSGGLSVKTAKNTLGSTLRAMLRDARRIDGYELKDAFLDIDWPAAEEQDIDPFTRDERDRIIEYFRTRRPHYYPFVFTLFATGMRPSEATALRWGKVDLQAGVLHVGRSRYLNAEAAPKTAHSRRQVRMVSELADVLRNMRPLHVAPDAYVFTNQRHQPVNHSNFGKTSKGQWEPACRGADVRPRKFYNTRHTFISLALSGGAMNPKFIADYCGTSLLMIQRNYGRWMADQTAEQMRKLEGLFEETEAGESRPFFRGGRK